MLDIIVTENREVFRESIKKGFILIKIYQIILELII